MSAKENTGMARSMIKPEPEEARIQHPFSASSPNTIQSDVKLKHEVELPNIHPLHSAVEAKPEDVQLPAAAVKEPSLYTRHDSAAEIVYTPEIALKEGLGMVETLTQALKKLKLGSKLRQDVWDRELDSLRSQTSPKTLIAVCGATGAGKSSILNAILDDNIVPTSGMRACTAVVTEIAYHDKRTIDADISFLSVAEWKQELSVLLTDLIDEDGQLKRSTDLKSDAGIAWQKVHAVYPSITQEKLVKMSTDEILASDPNIASILGTTKTIVAKDSKEFAKEIGKYIDSKDQSRGKKKKDKTKEKEQEKPKEKSLMERVRAAAAGTAAATSRSTEKKSDVPETTAAYWPLIRQVNVRCLAPALSTGAILVDLPGVADANAARNNIAKDYMKKCACIWILAPITRAVDDKTARDLLGDAFKLQLMMDGNYDAHTITFIASKCDDISCSEVIRALRLEDDPELESIEELIEANTDETRTFKETKATVEKLIKDINAELDEVRPRLEEYEAHLDALQAGEPFIQKLTGKAGTNTAKPTGKKRKNRRGGKGGASKRRRSSLESDAASDDDISDNDSDENEESGSESDSDDESDHVEGSDDVEEVTEESLKRHINECKAAIKDSRTRLSEARKQKKEVNDAIGNLQKTLAKLQRDKNAFCSLKRSEFSRDVLKEDFRTGLKNLDDSAAEERDPDHFDPTVNLRDYEAIDLPVFTCSSRDYVRLQGQIKGDGEPACFSNIKDTGIPDLQQWCHTLTLSSRQRSTRQFFIHLTTFLKSVQTYVQGIGEVTAVDREALRAKWESTQQGDDHPNEEVELGGHDIPQMWDDDFNPFSDILNGSNGLYTLNEPGPKVDVMGQLVGVAPRLAKEFSTIIDKSVADLQTVLRDGLEDKCRAGAENAAAGALETNDAFAGSMHWATYRATLRRHGSWRRDLNAELLVPFTKAIATSWGKIFENDLFAPFEKGTVEAVNKLISDVEGSATLGLKDRVHAQGELCLEEAKVALRNTVDVVRETMQNEQKEISRCLAPHVQERLIPGYNRAMEERGTGSVARQKAYFRSFVDDCKDDVFNDGADVLMDRLTAAADSIGQALDETLGKLAEKIEVNLAVLWERTRDDPKQVIARQSIIKLVSEVLHQTQLWTDAEKMKRENDEAARQIAQYLVDDDVDMNDA